MNLMSGSATRRAVSSFSLMLHEAGFVANHDGNVSAKTQGGRGFFITPTAISKRLCAPETIVECGADGKPISAGRYRPPSEVALHVGAYEAREDIAAVIHAHPPYASAFAMVGRPIEPISMPEVVVSIGDHIPVVPLYVPKDSQVRQGVQGALQIADVALMTGNGVLAVGPDLETAYLRLELVEHYAKILSICRGGVGEPAALSPEVMDKLIGLRKKAGLHRAADRTEGQVVDTVRAVVAEEVRRALKGKG